MLLLKLAPGRVDTRRMAPQVPKLPALRPDRVTIWPIDDDHFGADVLYLGRGAYQRAGDIERDLAAAGVAASFRQDVDGAWGVRLGPLERRLLLTLLDQVVGGDRTRRSATTPQRRPARAR